MVDIQHIGQIKLTKSGENQISPVQQKLKNVSVDQKNKCVYQMVHIDFQ